MRVRVGCLLSACLEPPWPTYPVAPPPIHACPGGIYGYPGDKKNANGKLRLLYECAPMSMICEQVGEASRAGRGQLRAGLAWGPRTPRRLRLGADAAHMLGA